MTYCQDDEVESAEELSKCNHHLEYNQMLRAIGVQPFLC